MEKEAITLSQLNSEIRDVIREHMARGIWLMAEISELKVNFSGHCYLELVQKDEHTEQTLARSRAMIWAQNYRLIRPYFETTTGQKLTEGLCIMVKVNVEFHEVFGLSLNILDIEPGYTVGEMALRKKKIIDRLEKEGVIDMNKDLELPTPSQKIAIISSPTAAGYEDFINQLEDNPYGYKFYHKLFPAIMQGEEAESSIISALDRIYSFDPFFDAVAIIRGGGSQLDLNCFNTYGLPYYITQFPLPVLTGIGHEQDDSVVDRVAHTRLKTPTAVAAYLIELMAEVENQLDEWTLRIVEKARTGISESSSNLGRTSLRLQQILNEKLSRYSHRLNHAFFHLQRVCSSRSTNLQRKLDHLRSQILLKSSSLPGQQRKSLQSMQVLLKHSVRHQNKQMEQKLGFYAGKLKAYDPARVLERGYSITLKEGKVVRDSKDLVKGDIVQTVLSKGIIESTIKKTGK